jgi:hypothetical protein
MFWALCLIPLICFAQQESTLIGFDENSASYERVTKEISVETTCPVQIERSYPVFFGEGLLIEHVNQELKTEVEKRFDNFVKDEKFSDEVREEECLLSYQLSPVYQAPNLISIFGCESHIRSGRGCSYYEGKNYWHRGGSIVKLVLDDLFIKGSEYHPFLLRYCENYFKSVGYGYYSSLKEFLPELDPNDLEIFVLTDEGLKIVFRAYRVGGWADGPDVVLIPYTELKEFIDPLGPLN